MRSTRITAGAAFAAALALALSACGGGDDGSDDKKGGNGTYNAGETAVVNPSTKTGGTIKHVMSDAPDSMDPGNTYYAYNWDFTRNYARPLLVFKSAPGEAGLELVADLAQGKGVSSNGGKTWTYKLKSGIKYEDGTVVKAADIKYAVARSNFTKELTDGPKYFKQYLDVPASYPGPYKEKDLAKFTGVEAPDDTTVVFKLNQPFAEFDYLVSNPQTSPVPQAKDTGLKYEEHPVSVGPYKFESHEVGKSFVLVKNTNWDPATDSERKQLVDRIEMTEKVAAADIDNRLLAGTAHVDTPGTGVQAAARAKILRSDALKKNADNPYTGFLRYAMISTKVKPFDNIECRKAVQYAIDRTATQGAYGGPIAGEIATTALPPTESGYTKYDLFETPGNKGDVTKAKAALTACGKAGGFTTNIAVRGDRDKEVDAATAMQASLKQVGINVQIKKYPSGDWISQYAGKPDFVHKNNLGIMITGWGSDWPSGFGFLSQIAHGKAIKDSGNYNMMDLNDPAVNKALDDGIKTLDDKQRETFWTTADKKIMESAALLPFIYEKTLLYRPENVTNVYFHKAYKMYDYNAMGLK